MDTVASWFVRGVPWTVLFEVLLFALKVLQVTKVVEVVQHVPVRRPSR